MKEEKQTTISNQESSLKQELGSNQILFSVIIMLVPAAIFLGMTALFSYLDGFDTSSYVNNRTLLILAGSYVVGLVCMFLVSKKFEMGLAAFGLLKRRIDITTIAIGIISGAIVFVLLYLIPYYIVPHYVIDTAVWRSVPGALLYLFFLLVVPFCDELIFRGFGYRAIAGKRSSTEDFIIAIGVVAVIGAVIHIALGPFAFIQGVLQGLVFGLLRYTTKSLLPAIGCHFVINLLIGLLLFW